MLDSVINLLTYDFMPHGHCYLWTPGIMWSHAVSDTLIAISYFSIPIALFYFASKKKDLAFKWVFVLFAVFITTCGAGHLIDVWNIWNGAYWLSSFIRIATALASVATAIAVWPLVPKALAIPSRVELESLNTKLEKEVEKRTEELKEQVAALESKNEELKHFSAMMVGREKQMVNLKTRNKSPELDARSK